MTVEGEQINAGAYAVTATTLVGENAGNYKLPSENTYEFEICPKQVSDPTIEIARAIYTGEALEPAVTVKDGETVIPSNEYTVTYSGNVNAGTNTATVTITDKADGNYTVSGNNTFSIQKAAVAYTFPAEKEELIYSGDPQELVTAGETSTGTMYYALGDNGETAPDFDGLSTEENKTWKTTVPKATEPGT